MIEMMVEANNLYKSFPVPSRTLREKAKVLQAVGGVSLSIPKGSIFGVVGESGCGKSTLGRCLLRMESITSGSLTFQGQDITSLSGKELKPIRRHMQMIFQNPYASFNPKQRIGSALHEVAKVHQIPMQEAEDKINHLLKEINLPDDTLHRVPSEMSGGQLQRLAIARALLLTPDFIVADEPVSALDVSVQAQILNLLMDLRQKFSLTMLFISHEMTVVRYLCDQVAVMYLGMVVEQAETEELFKNLLHPYTQTLMSAVPSIDPDEKMERVILQGDLPSAIDLPKGCPFAPRCIYCSERCKEERPELREVVAGHKVACHLV
ncbi:MAG: oppF [Evtepia sp.]|jgi:peptide/nickel transport system ATP-binding protein/oligopeptide transport system ATP-binding protein|nr:oppF [Evtepia sp.]